MARKIKMNAEQVARLAKRESEIAAIQTAIGEGRAYLNTSHNGRRKVVSYDPNSGWAITNNGGGSFDQQSYMVGYDQIKVA